MKTRHYISLALGLAILWAIIPSQAKQLILQSWPWYLTRAAGLVSALLLFLLIVFGIGLVTGFTYRIWEPLKAWAIHRSIGIALCFSLAVHIVSLLFDKVNHFSLSQVLVPFLSSFRQTTVAGLAVGSLYLALGILAFYLLVPIIFTSLVTMDKNRKQWKLIHYAGYVVVAAVFFHSLYLGTDMKSPLVHTLMITGGITLLVAAALRLLRLGGLKKG